jgi:hypothetical protein
MAPLPAGGAIEPNRSQCRSHWRGRRSWTDCSLEGLSLAGVPLLRTTPIGLAPRSRRELAELMSRAYAHDVDLSSLSSGLDVIAKALNGGDIGRAMIAALHLRLPALSWTNAARIARAETALAKDYQTELRDWLGRWTTGGGASRVSSVKPKPAGGHVSGGSAPRRTVSPGPSQAVRPNRATAPTFVPSPMTIAGRLAVGEEVVGGGPEDPVADVAALATLGIGALLATSRQPGAGRRGRPRSSHACAIPLGPDDDEREELLTKDRINCQIVNAAKGYQKGAVCRAVAMARYSECRRGGLGNVRTPPYWGN